MNNAEALTILNNAIKGIPNSCNSEHARQLEKIVTWLKEAPAAQAVADAPPAPPPPPILKKYRVTVTLQDVFSAEDEREAWELALDKISTRKGMNLCGDVVEELT